VCVYSACVCARARVDMCVCVCERERERECVCIVTKQCHLKHLRASRERCCVYSVCGVSVYSVCVVCESA
jgi:hypothetical protein